MKAFAVKTPDGEIYSDSIRNFESNCKIDFVKGNWDSDEMDWIAFDRLGFECVPVLITEVKTEK